MDLPWDELPSEVQAHLSATYNDLIARVWLGNPICVGADSFTGHAQALGLSSTEEPNGIRKYGLLKKYPDLVKAAMRARREQNFYDLCNHREYIVFNYLSSALIR